MNIRLNKLLACTAPVVFAAITFAPSAAFAQRDHAHATEAQKADASPLVAVVRAATERFKDVAVAEAEGYTLQFGCVSGPDAGAMGMHFVNGPLVGDGQLDPAGPGVGDLGAAAEWPPAADWRRFSGARRRVERDARRS